MKATVKSIDIMANYVATWNFFLRITSAYSMKYSFDGGILPFIWLVSYVLRPNFINNLLRNEMKKLTRKISKRHEI